MNTRILLLFLFALGICLLLASCGDCSKRIDCPGFADDTLTRLFPYTDNQRLVFRSDTGGTLIVTLRNAKTTEPYQAVGGPYGRQPVCSEEKIFQSEERDTAFRGPAFSVHLQSGNNHQSVSVSLNQNAFSFTNFTDTSFRTVSLGGFQTVPVFRGSVTVGNRTFFNVMVAQRDTSGEKRSGVYRLFYTRAEGVVGYTDFPSNVNWVKQ